MNDMVTVEKMVKQEANEIEFEDQTSHTDSSVLTNPRRNRPGTSTRDWCKWPDQELDEMESTLAVQQVLNVLLLLTNYS